MVGGETYVKKIPSMNIVDIARTIASNCSIEITGIRPGEKLHEQMISAEDAMHTYEYPGYYKILPVINNWDQSLERIKNGVRVKEGFTYSSDNNKDWMTSDKLLAWIKANENIL